MPTNGFLKAKATACAALNPTSKAIGRPGPLRGGDGIQLQIGRDALPRDNFAIQRGLHDGNQIPQMFAGGQFRHDTAVFRVQLDL